MPPKSPVERIMVWFLVGFGWELVCTFDVLFTANQMILAAGATTFVLNMLSFTIYGKIISQIDGGTRFQNAASIALGAACGAMLSISIF